MNYLKMMKKRPMIDVWHFFMGNYRYKLYYSGYFKWLIRWHIREQIAFRMDYIPDECYNQGSCVECGCQVPHLQMAAKSCDRNCYPKFMNGLQWSRFMTDHSIKQEKRIWSLNSATKILTLVIENAHRYVSERKSKLR